MSDTLRKFGFNLGLGLNIVGCIMFYRHREHFIWFTTIGSVSLILALMYPKALMPVKEILDKVIFAFSWIVNMVLLLTAFYLIFTPIAILLRVFGKDALHQRIDKKANSYWIKRKENIFTKKFYERMG